MTGSIGSIEGSGGTAGIGGITGTIGSNTGGSGGSGLSGSGTRFGGSKIVSSPFDLNFQVRESFLCFELFYWS